MVHTGQSRSRSYNFVLTHFLNLEGPFRWVMIFLTSIDPLKSVVTARREFISFHQNDDIVNVRSFQSFALITKASHGNDFLSLNLQTYRHRYISIKETNDNFNKCIKHKRSQQSHRSITTEIKKNGLSSLNLFRQHFQSFLGSLTPWKVYLCDAQPSEYSSHLVPCN